MSQNIYDSDAFFEEYSKYPRAVNGLEGASEWPLLKTLLPKDMTSLAVLDLGCGDGWFSRWAADQGAKSVLALDVSRNMLDRARDLTAAECHNVIEFRQVDMEDLSLQEDTFDVIFSGLALHYPENLVEILQKLYRSLKAGGAFIFSIEHPIFTAPRNPGFDRDELTGRTYWPLTDYLDEGERSVTWLGARVRKQHHTMETWVNELVSAGFGIVALNKWGATQEEGRKHPNWPNEGVIPRFMIFSARKSFRSRSRAMSRGKAKSPKLRQVVVLARMSVLLSKPLRKDGAWQVLET